MNYVLDASVGICWVIRRPLTHKALQLRDDFRQSIHQLSAPSIFPVETASGLTKAERQKLITQGEARPLLLDVLKTQRVLHPVGPLLLRATDISSQTRCGLNDCLYVALAEREGCDMITADDKLLRNIQHQFPFVKHLSSI